jgi:NAD(P)-dependent dehydrogenase (short-subunit alcohol dehydrogenase family)
VAIELARRGFSVVATMRDPSAGSDLSDQVGEGGGPMRIETLDIRNVGTFRYPDDLRVLVNNAGARSANLPVEETAMEDWRDVFETNVFGTVDMIRRAVPILRQHGGVICNITTSSLLPSLPFFGTYRASKAAISVLSETLRVELAPFGIRVVEILPGPIDTQMFRTSVMFKVPEAAQYEPYRRVAQEHFPALRFLDQGLITPPARAAVAIVDAICEDDGPMRYGCDPMSIASLEEWRQRGDEPAMREAIAHFKPGGSA